MKNISIPSFIHEIKRPLISIPSVALLLDVMEMDIEKMVAADRVVAFNIALPKSGRSYVRVMTLSLSNLALGKETTSHLVGQIIPVGHIIFSGLEVARILHCCPTHITNLIKNKCLVEIGRHSPKNESPKISRASLVSFLSSRRVA